MRFVSFCVRLTGSAGIAAAGMVLMILGIRALFTLYIFADEMSQQPALVGEGTNWDMLTRNGAGLYGRAALGGWSIIIGELLIGLVLLIIGFRGLMIRLTHGLPPPAEAAETAEGRLGHILAFGAGTVLGLFLLVSGLVNNIDHLIPKLLGETANAVVIGGRTSQDHYSYLSYQFITAEKRLVRHELKVLPQFLHKYKEGAELEVRYMPGDPTQNILPDVVSYTEFTFYMGLYAFLVVAGVAGVRRNLDYVDPAYGE